MLPQVPRPPLELSPQDEWSWQQREPIEGVAFRRGDPVVVVRGGPIGQRGRTDRLVRLSPEPRYIVIVDHDNSTIAVRQSALRSAHSESPTGVLAELCQWYAAQTDGDWEHSEGIVIDTLDNPGWSLRISLTDTVLAGRPFTEIDVRPQTDGTSLGAAHTDWMFCRVEGETWQASCGPFMLERAIREFLSWAEAPRDESPSAGIF
jgi:hypothetical protein